MPIAYDNASNSGYQSAQSSYSWSHVCSGSNTFLAVDIAFPNDSGTTVTSITYNGINLTLIGATNVSGGNGRVESWGLIAPTTGTNTVAVTLSASSNSIGMAVSYSGVGQGTPTEAYTSTSSSASTGSQSLPVGPSTLDGCWVHGAIATRDSGATAPSVGPRNNASGASGAGFDSDSNGSIGVAGSSGSVSFTINTSAAFVMNGYVLRPLSVTIPKPSFLQQQMICPEPDPFVWWQQPRPKIISVSSPVTTSCICLNFGSSNTNKNVTASDASLPSGGSSFTMSCWFKYTGSLAGNISPSYGLPMGYGTFGSTTYVNIGISSSTGTNAYTFVGGGLEITGTGSVTSGWHHIAAVSNGTSVTLYVDGTSRGTGTRSSSLALNQVAIGGESFFGFFKGEVMDCRVYNTNLTSGNITSIYNGGCPNFSDGIATANRVGWWKLNEGTGSTAADSSGNAHNGTLNNSPTWTADCPCPPSTAQPVSISQQFFPAQEDFTPWLTKTLKVTPSGSTTTTARSRPIIQQTYYPEPDSNVWWQQQSVRSIVVSIRPAPQLQQMSYPEPVSNVWWLQSLTKQVIVTQPHTTRSRPTPQQAYYETEEQPFHWWQQKIIRKYFTMISSTTADVGTFSTYATLIGDAAEQGVFRVQNQIAGYNVYIAANRLPDLNLDTPTFTATLPHSIALTAPASGTTAYYTIITSQNLYGLESVNQFPSFPIIINSSGNQVLPPIPAPLGLQLTLLPAEKIRVLATYPGASTDKYPATSWKVWINTVLPDPGVDTPTAIVSVSGTNLTYTSATQTPGLYYVMVALYRLTDTSLSPTIYSTIVVNGLPDEPTAVPSGFQL